MFINVSPVFLPSKYLLYSLASAFFKLDFKDFNYSQYGYNSLLTYYVLKEKLKPWGLFKRHPLAILCKSVQLYAVLKLHALSNMF